MERQGVPCAVYNLTIFYSCFWIDITSRLERENGLQERQLVAGIGHCRRVVLDVRRLEVVRRPFSILSFGHRRFRRVGCGGWGVLGALTVPGVVCVNAGRRHSVRCGRGTGPG